MVHVLLFVVLLCSRSAVHRNPSASGLFVQAVHSRSEYISKVRFLFPRFTAQVLCLLMFVHHLVNISFHTIVVAVKMDAVDVLQKRREYIQPSLN